MGPALVRPLLAAVLAGTVAVVVARLAGPYPMVQLAIAGTAGVLAYIPVAVPLDQLRRWRTVLRGTQPAGALE